MTHKTCLFIEKCGVVAEFHSLNRVSVLHAFWQHSNNAGNGTNVGCFTAQLRVYTSIYKTGNRTLWCVIKRSSESSNGRLAFVTVTNLFVRFDGMKANARGFEAVKCIYCGESVRFKRETGTI